MINEEELLWNEGPPEFQKSSEENPDDVPYLPLPEYTDGGFDVGPSSSSRKLYMEEDVMATWLLDPPSMGSSCDHQGRGLEFLDAGKVFDTESASPDLKRKQVRDPESVGEQDVDVEFGRKIKDPHHSRPTRARTAEVHNLSERRRRDRINEKMKALQELVPRCNKSDKASMLDDAIEYMKSLQLQVQMLSSMQYNIGQLMFPDPQRYMQTMGLMGMNLSLGMGMAPGMDVSVRGMQRPAVPIEQFLPYNPFIIPHPANLRPLPVPSFQPTNVAITDSASNYIDMRGSNMMQIPTFGDPHCQYPGLHHVQASTQVQNLVEPSSGKGTDTYSEIGNG